MQVRNRHQATRRLLILGVISLMILLTVGIAVAQPPRAAIIANCISQAIVMVDPDVKEWTFQAAAPTQLAEDPILDRIVEQLRGRGYELMIGARDSRVEVKAAHKQGLFQYLVVVGCYSPPWGGVELECTASMLKGWSIDAVRVLAQS